MSQATTTAFWDHDDPGFGPAGLRRGGRRLILGDVVCKKRRRSEDRRDIGQEFLFNHAEH